MKPSGFDVRKTVEFIIEAAQRNTYMTFGDIPDTLGRSWPERRHGVPRHLQDIVLHCRDHGLPLLSSRVVNKGNLEGGGMEPSGIKGFALGAQDAGYSVDNDHAAFLRKQQQLALEYAARAPRVQRAFLITWKEGGWPAEELEAFLARFNSDPSTTEPWRMQSHRQCAVGDKIYALKQGDGPNIIFGVGDRQPAFREDLGWQGPLDGRGEI